MKKIVLLLGLSLLIFVIITFLTARIQAPIDGSNYYGFPFTFHTFFGGKRINPLTSSTETHFELLILDFLFAGLIAIGLERLYKFFTK